MTETNATTIGYSADELVAWPGQLRQVVYLLLARGARMIEYWHWHTNRFGAETWWEGILTHSLQPGRTYRELSAVGHELAEHRAVLTRLEPLSQVGLIVSAESRWGWRRSRRSTARATCGATSWRTRRAWRCLPRTV